MDKAKTESLNETQNTAPVAPKCKVEELPDTLQRDGRFCCWKYVEKDGRWTKKPIDPRTACAGDSSDPKKFSGLPTAEGCQTHHADLGIGLGIFGNIGAIDIDDCRDDTGRMSDFSMYVKDIIGDTYTEISPSGRGIRILFTIPAGFTYDKEKYYVRNPHQKIELYIPGMTSRFVTLTGDAVTPGRDLLECGDAVKVLLDECMKRPEHKKNPATITAAPLNLSDAELLNRIEGSNDQKAKDLLSGNWEKYPEYPSQSEADLGLCVKLAYWTQENAEQMERLFSVSPLANRDKWQTREAYRRDTIAEAIEINNTVYDPYYKQKREAEESERQSVEGSPQTSDITVAIPDATDDTETASDPEEDQKPDQLNNFLNAIYSERFRPIPTGITSIDETLCGGIIPQTLVILSAPPAAGKTALMSEIFENFARSGRKCIYLNLEMSEEQMLARALSKQIYMDRGLKFSSLYILQGYRQTPDDAEIVRDAVTRYRETVYPNMRYNPDNKGANLTDILAYMDHCAEPFRKRGEPGPIFAVDYLHLLEGDPREDPAEMLKRATIELKKYAVKNDTVVFAISAQNRQANKKKSANMESGRDTSALEYSGDYLLQLIEGEGKEKDNNIVNLCVNKNRFGKADPDHPTKLKFMAEQSYFTDPAYWEVNRHAEKKSGRV